MRLAERKKWGVAYWGGVAVEKGCERRQKQGRCAAKKEWARSVRKGCDLRRGEGGNRQVRWG